MIGEAKKSLKKLICAGLIGLALAGCARAALVDSNSIVQDDIQYYIQTDKSVYNSGENVQMLYRVTNVSENPVHIEGVLNCEYGWAHFIITDDDNNEIWQWLHGPPPCGWATLHLDPGEFKEHTKTWNMMNDNGTYQYDDDFPIGPGLYNIMGELFRGGGYERVPVSVSIEVIPEPAMIYYVDADANGVNDGSSWSDAYNYLQDALADANSGANSGDEIWVAQGIYKPDQGVGITPCDRTATFQLTNGVAIKGGYAGFGEPDPNARDVEVYETILSGDLNGNDVDVNDPVDLLNEPTRSENSYHVLTGSGTDANAILDGFTITGGYANGEGWPVYLNRGGGIYSDSGSPTLMNCTISGNSASVGGGMYNFGSSPTVTNCTFSGNSASGSGGGMYNNGDSSATLSNCTFSGNSAERGGGMFNLWCNPVLTNCTFSGNSATYGAGILNDESSLTLTNCILWDDGLFNADGLTLTITYSDLQGIWAGEGNIDADPCFADAANGDYHLKSQAGRWEPSSQSWVQDDVTSPCIDAGNPNGPIGYEPFPNGGRINMGVYGGTAEASKSYFGEPICETIVAGDINGDCKVDFLDFALFSAHWLERVNQQPEVYITEPPDGFEFYWLQATVMLKAHAWDVDGSVVKVEFFVNGIKWGSEARYIGNDLWIYGTCFDVGTYILTARATDNEGARAISPPVTITAFGNICPEVYITQPEDGAVIDYGIDTMVIEAVASDPDGSVVKVTFYLDGVKLCEDNDGTDGWRVCISPPEPGTHTLVVVATDNERCGAASPKITFTVE